MDEEQRSILIDALENAFAEVGVDLYKGSPRLLGLIDRTRPHVEACCSREGLNRYLATMSDKDAENLPTYAAFFAAIPTLLEEFVRDCVVNTAASIPSPVGPPTKLTPEIKRQIVSRVTQLYVVDGVRIGNAQIRVARQFGVGKRTVQAVWGKRHQLASQPFQSISDVWKFFE